MSIDNDGEGGVLALMALLAIKKHQRPAIVALGLFGAALIYGDGAITPAISVLSALEGLNIVTPAFQPYVLPSAVAILVALFVIQPLGTSWIGKAFGPVMVLWFLVMAVLGIWGIAHHPAVLAAVNPLYGLRYLFSNGYASFLVLGGVFLCVTGAEALYADMGHFGSRPIRLAWSGVVFPSVLLVQSAEPATRLAAIPGRMQHASAQPASTPSSRNGDVLSVRHAASGTRRSCSACLFVGTTAPAIPHREPAGCRRQCRHHDGRAFSSGWLYAAHDQCW